METPVIILGGGGHAKVLIDTLLLQSISIIGIVLPSTENKSKKIMGIEIIGEESELDKYSPDQVELVNGVGSIGSMTKRKEVYERFTLLGYRFANVVHPSAIIASDVELSEGVQVMAGAIIQTGCRIGANTIINTKASVDHDCLINNHVHISPGSTLSGGVRVHQGVHIGTGATIIQGIVIGESSLVSAGAVVVKDVNVGATVVGVPAREVSE
jgi:sugar O-acyltransferase (sialic acid O-acetyltransferase NeuD family)